MIPSLAIGKGLPKPDENGWWKVSDKLPEYGITVWAKRFKKTAHGAFLKHRYRVAYRTEATGWLDEYTGMAIKDVMCWRYINGPIED